MSVIDDFFSNNDDKRNFIAASSRIVLFVKATMGAMLTSIWGEIMFGYLSLKIIFSEQIMSAGKYPSIFSR